MFPRNLTIYRFPTTLDTCTLDAGLAECALKPVSTLELQSRGFIPPLGGDTEALVHTVGTAMWLAIGTETRLLPGAVVNSHVQAKLDEIEEKEGRRPGGRTRRRIKDDVITELLPRAFVQPGRVDAYLLPALGLLAIDTASRKVADSVVSDIRRALGSFPALPLSAEVAPRSVLTGWLAGEAMPEGLALGDEAELRDALDQGAKVRVSAMELAENAEIDKHLQSGKQCTRLAVTLDDHISMVLGEDLTIRKFKLLDGAVDSLENTEREDLKAELDARFALLAGELARVFAVLEPALKLSKVEG